MVKAAYNVTQTFKDPGSNPAWGMQVLYSTKLPIYYLDLKANKASNSSIDNIATITINSLFKNICHR